MAPAGQVLPADGLNFACFVHVRLTKAWYNMGNDIEEAAVMNFWQRMKDSLTRWMYGRYGADQLSRVILYASLF